MDNQLKQFAQSSQLAGGNASYVEDLYEQYLVYPGQCRSQMEDLLRRLQGPRSRRHSALGRHLPHCGRGQGSAEGRHRQRCGRRA
ncbi:hypothetical protein BN1263280188 [Stenotrophomonas maltophilia]|nr:hypothetical protein BN1263280188 [Stenotrophomonas maltophilia]